ncbi:alanine racemase [Yoonia sp. SS1-5]|uniref:Alanine racemase n=1 Tax=Yoonia rhodophyticola TaxID=3137370 RepID=A0AAN0MIG5_9RHOB
MIETKPKPLKRGNADTTKSSRIDAHFEVEMQNECENRPGRHPYFEMVRQALKSEGVTQPTIVVDLDLFDRNLDRLLSMLPADMAFRLVVKSLPIPDLIQRALERANTKRVMTFNLPMLQTLASTMPQLDHLLGKPFPVAAAKAFLTQGGDAAQVHWLIDTPERLAQYGQLAQDTKTVLNICLELDIGLHRGGFARKDALVAALDQIADCPQLNLTGVMGYDAHVGKAPTAFGLQRSAEAKTKKRFEAALDIIRAVLGNDVSERIIRNGAGSPTLPFYKDADIVNDISAGSVLVKPTDFDLPHLSHFAPAAFIATPALKVLDGVQMPVLEWLDPIRNLFARQKRKSVFIHGGYWKAVPVDPAGLKHASLIGRSSNQELLVGPSDMTLKPDDFVLFRPTQSEAVMLQFGPIATIKDHKFAGWMDPLPMSA